MRMPSNEDSRDLRLTLITALSATPAAILLALAFTRLIPSASPSRPETVLAALICLGVSILLLRASAVCWLALMTRLSILPGALRIITGRIVLMIGSGAARRLVMRSASASALSVAALGLTGAALASPLPLEEGAPLDSISWMWRPTDAGAEGARNTEARANERAARPSPVEDAPSGAGGASELPRGASGEAFAPGEGAGAPEAFDEAAPSIPGSAADEGAAPPAPPAPGAPPRIAAMTTPPGGAAPLDSEPGPEPARVTVLPGDSLWSIAEALLAPGAPDARIDASWRALYAANAAAIGPNPSLIRPGDVLSIPQELK